MTAAQDQQVPTEDTAEHLRNEMVLQLQNLGAVHSDTLTAALRTVPRHRFVPDVLMTEAYEPTRAIVTKRDARGAAMSSLSESHIQATMLEQAGIEPGMRVLEVGTGGYNAALIAELVGPDGEVTSVDIDPDIVGNARQCLADTGYDRVNVVLADAEDGVPDHAPFDRILITAGAWDIPPAWIRQLADGGRMVVPLRMRGLTRSVAFEAEGDHLVSRGYQLCGFVPMQGASSHTEQVLTLEENQVVLRIDGPHDIDISGLQESLFGRRVELFSGVEVGGEEPIHDIDLYVATAADTFGLLNGTKQAADSGTVSRSALHGAKTIVEHASFAYRAAARPVGEDPTRFELGVIAHGPDADRIAEQYLAHIRTWDATYRGTTAATISAYPAGTADSALPAGRVIDKLHTRVVLSWP